MKPKLALEMPRIVFKHFVSPDTLRVWGPQEGKASQTSGQTPQVCGVDGEVIDTCISSRYHRVMWGKNKFRVPEFCQAISGKKMILGISVSSCVACKITNTCHISKDGEK